MLTYFVKKIAIVLLYFLFQNFTMAQSGKFQPPLNMALLIIGQDLGAIGGFEVPNNDGYNDYFSVIPAGFTSYTSIINLEGLNTNANYGNGDMCAKKIIDNQNHKGTVLCMGLYLVGILDEIARGNYDSEIISLANWIKDTNVPVYLRIGYEFNGSHNNYNPDDYKSAYIRICTKIKEQGVENVAYVWQSDGLGTKSDLMQWYPGDGYVDWLGYSHFHNRGEGIIEIARDKNKPVMIAEATPRGSNLSTGDGETIWNSWFKPLFEYITENPEIQALCYINTDWDSKSMWEGQGWGDTRIHKNVFIADAWLNEINREKWINRDDGVYSNINFSPMKINNTISKGVTLLISNRAIVLNSSINEFIDIKIYNTSGKLLFVDNCTTNSEINIPDSINGLVIINVLKQNLIIHTQKVLIN